MRRVGAAERFHDKESRERSEASTLDEHMFGGAERLTFGSIEGCDDAAWV